MHIVFRLLLGEVVGEVLLVSQSCPDGSNRKEMAFDR